MRDPGKLRVSVETEANLTSVEAEAIAHTVRAALKSDGYRVAACWVHQGVLRSGPFHCSGEPRCGPDGDGGYYCLCGTGGSSDNDKALHAGELQQQGYQDGWDDGCG